MSDSLKPQKVTRTAQTDEQARCVYTLLVEVAERITKATKVEPAITPPSGGMARLGGRDRASFVWFLPCHPEAPNTPDGSRPASCNHGLGVDRVFGSYEVRAWAHGRPGVHDVSLHTGQVTTALLEQAAALVGIPVAPAEDEENKG